MTAARSPVFTRHPISATPQYGVVLQPGDKLEATDVYDSTTGQWSACPCPGLTVQEGCDTIWIRPRPLLVRVPPQAEPPEPSEASPEHFWRECEHAIVEHGVCRACGEAIDPEDLQ